MGKGWEGPGYQGDRRQRGPDMDDRHGAGRGGAAQELPAQHGRAMVTRMEYGRGGEVQADTMRRARWEPWQGAGTRWTRAVVRHSRRG